MKISNGLKIIIKNYQKKIPVNPKRIKKAILNVLSCERVNKPGEISVCFVDDTEIIRLNKRYCKKCSATDVLSFDITDPLDKKHLFADIAISSDTAWRNSGIFKTTPGYELRLYVIHGILHLVGYDDQSPTQRKLMRRKEKKYVDRKN